MLLGTGRNLRPVQGRGFLAREAEEVVGEAVAVAAHLLVQALGGHAVELGEVRVDHDLVAADHEDSVGDAREIRRWGPGHITSILSCARLIR